MEIKLVNKSNNETPSYASKLAAGLDLRAFTNEHILIKPMERKLIHTGLFIELPQGFEAQIRPRSGLALKHGITVLNSPGTIDADYRGEIMVLLINFGSDVFEIKNGDRIAQMIVSNHASVEFVEVRELTETERGAAGYGSTGKK